MEIDSSRRDLLNSSKSEARTRPRVLLVSILGHLIMTVVDGAGVTGQSFQIRGLVAGVTVVSKKLVAKW
jgi:hypothetical protein